MKLNPEIVNYCIQNSEQESTLLEHVHRETHLKTIKSNMVSGHLQGRLLSMISKLVKPKRILELGTFTGYATLCLAEGLAEDGMMDTIEKMQELDFLIAEHINSSAYADKIKVRYGPALEILPTLKDEYELIFIDAAKAEYCEYYDLLFEKWASDGVMIVDNVIWYGHILDPEKDPTTKAIHLFNKKIKNDDRVENFILPFRDGLNVIRKK